MPCELAGKRAACMLPVSGSRPSAVRLRLCAQATGATIRVICAGAAEAGMHTHGLAMQPGSVSPGTGRAWPSRRPWDRCSSSSGIVRGRVTRATCYAVHWRSRVREVRTGMQATCSRQPPGPAGQPRACHVRRRTKADCRHAWPAMLPHALPGCAPSCFHGAHTQQRGRPPGCAHISQREMGHHRRVEVAARSGWQLAVNVSVPGRPCMCMRAHVASRLVLCGHARAPKLLLEQLMGSMRLQATSQGAGAADGAVPGQSERAWQATHYMRAQMVLGLRLRVHATSWGA